MQRKRKQGQNYPSERPWVWVKWGESQEGGFNSSGNKAKTEGGFTVIRNSETCELGEEAVRRSGRNGGHRPFKGKGTSKKTSGAGALGEVWEGNGFITRIKTEILETSKNGGPVLTNDEGI